MRILVPAVLIAALLASLAPAQAHPGGVLIGAGYPTNSNSYLNGLFMVSKTGKMTTFIDTYTATRPNYFLQPVMGLDNKSLVFGCRGSGSSSYSLTYGIFKYDPDTMKYSTIARSTSIYNSVYGLQSNQDGDWFVNAKSTVSGTNYYVYKVTNSGSETTVLTTLQLGHKQVFSYPLGQDVDTGDLLIPSSQSLGFFTRPVYALSSEGTVSTWNLSPAGPAPTNGWDQEIATGDILYMNASYVYRCKKGQDAETYTRVDLSPESAYTLAYENQSLAKPLLMTYSFRQISTFTTANIQYLDPSNKYTITKTLNFISATSSVKIPYPQLPILNHQERYFQTVKTGAGQWDMLFNFPTLRNKTYIVAAGMSGVRPGLLLGDGRHVWLNFDDLVRLTVDNKIAIVFNPGPQILNNKGQATGKINLTYLPLPLKLTIHILVAVIDPGAPGGIAFITEPYPMRL